MHCTREDLSQVSCDKRVLTRTPSRESVISLTGKVRSRARRDYPARSFPCNDQGVVFVMRTLTS